MTKRYIHTYTAQNDGKKVAQPVSYTQYSRFTATEQVLSTVIIHATAVVITTATNYVCMRISIA